MGRCSGPRTVSKDVDNCVSVNGGGGGVDGDLAAMIGEARVCPKGAKLTLAGEKGGVVVVDRAKTPGPLYSGCGVVLDEANDMDCAGDSCTSGECNVSSRLNILLPLVGETLFAVRRLEKLPLPSGKIRFVGLTFSRSCDETVTVLD